MTPTKSLLALVFAIFLQTTQVLAQNGDGGGVPTSDTQPTSAAAANAQGASGAQGGSVNLSTGQTVAIAVVVALVIIVALGTTVLWYLAKKRQWRVRETIRKSARKVTDTILSPITPKTGTFSFSPRATTQSRFGSAAAGGREMHNVGAEKQKSGSKVRHDEVDLEKGSTAEKTRSKPKLGITVPRGPVDMGPATAKPSVWTRVFGKD